MMYGTMSLKFPISVKIHIRISYNKGNLPVHSVISSPLAFCPIVVFSVLWSISIASATVAGECNASSILAYEWQQQQ